MATNENYPFVGYIADEGKVEYANPVNYAELPLHFIAEEDMTVSFTNPLQYSLDNKTWIPLAKSTATPTINAGSTIYFKATGLTPNSSSGVGRFSTTGHFIAAGNVKSMLLGDNFIEDSAMPNYAFIALFAVSLIIDAHNLIIPYGTMAQHGCERMFYNCSSLVSAPVLPATTLADSCYYNMFGLCSSLVSAPVLPATTLAKNCYYYMFQNCSSLVTAPELSATILVSNCYAYMFQNCSNLQYIKAMFGTTPGSGYTSDWVSEVKSTGTFVKNAAATWNVTGVNGIPSGWNVETATE